MFPRTSASLTPFSAAEQDTGAPAGSGRVREQGSGDGVSGWQLILAISIDCCWAVFALVWLAGIVINMRRAPAVRRRARVVVPSVAVVVPVVLLAVFVPRDVWRPVTYRATWLAALGLVLLVASTAFTVWARLRLGTLWTVQAVVKEHHELRTDGPYAVTRHPIYTGILGMVLGTVLATGLGFGLVVLVLVVVLLLMKIRVEERLLSGEFPDEYATFRRQVPQLVPRLPTRFGANGPFGR